MGGPTQRFARVGDRWVLSVSCRSMSYAQSVGVVAVLNQGTSNKLLCPVPQPGLTIGSPGSPVVSSGSGTSLSISGFTSGYGIQAGQMFSIVHGGVRYLHQATAAVTASGGSATIVIQPMLKVVVTAGDVCEFAVPYIEGFGATSQDIVVNRNNASALNFTITEAQ